MDLFKVLGNANRRNILKILLKKNMHISALAKELGISTPVALKHILVLEKAGLIEREQIGNTHVLKLKRNAMKPIEKVWNLVEKPFTVQVKEGDSLLNALKKVSGLGVEKKPDGIYITSVDGKKGFYVFQVNGKLPDKSADQILLKKDVEIELQKLIPVIGKKILIKVEKQ